MNILINNRIVNFKKDDFPMLISGVEKSGASFFSVCLVANLLKNGFKTLFFSAYPMAKEEFRKQTNSKSNSIIIDSGEEEDFLKVFKNITDLSERLILIKNIDNYSFKLFDAVKDLKLVIFSGDIDKCQFADNLIKKDFSTKIFFSQSKKYPNKELLGSPKYCGNIINDKYEGIISLDIIK